MLTDIEIHHYGAQCDILPDTAKRLYRNECHPRKDRKGAAAIAVSQCKQDEKIICTNDDDNVTILKNAMKPYSNIFKRTDWLIKSIQFYTE